MSGAQYEVQLMRRGLNMDLREITGPEALKKVPVDQLADAIIRG